MVEIRKPDKYVSYPVDGGTATIPTGEVVIDFWAGSAIKPNGTIDRFIALREFGLYPKSVYIDATKQIKWKLDGGNWMDCDESSSAGQIGLEFRTLTIKNENAEDVGIRVYAITNPSSIYRGISKWGIPREPYWVDGVESTAPGALATLVSVTVGVGLKGRIFGISITADEDNSFRLYSGATVIKRFALGMAGTIFFVVPNPILTDVVAGTTISIKNVGAGGAGIIYQASILYDEGA